MKEVGLQCLTGRMLLLLGEELGYNDLETGD